MKKINVILSAVALCGAFASTSFAGAVSIAGSTIIGGGTFAPSSKVGISLIATTTSYAAASAHLSGTKEYGTVGGAVAATADPTKIMTKTIPTQSSTTVGVPTSQTDATQLTGSGWQ